MVIEEEEVFLGAATGVVAVTEEEVVTEGEADSLEEGAEVVADLQEEAVEDEEVPEAAAAEVVDENLTFDCVTFVFYYTLN